MLIQKVYNKALLSDNAGKYGFGKINVMEPKIDPKALVARVDGLGFATHDRVLFQDLDLNIKTGEVIAITGKSGSGKTVLLKILANKEKPQEGKVFLNPKAKVIFVPQELEDIDIDKHLTIKELLKNSRGLANVEGKIAKYKAKLSSQTNDKKDLEEYDNLKEEYRELGGYSSDADIRKVLSGLDLDKNLANNVSLDTKLDEVSSGQLRKIMIAMALYSKANLILIDEPSSHLDVPSVDWLADYLGHTSRAAVIASNNSNLLDKCASRTVGLTDIGRVFVFEGSYSDFILKRDAVLDAEKSEARQVTRKLEQLKKTDTKFRAKQVYKRSPAMAQVGRALESRMNRLHEQYENMPGSKNVYIEEKIKELLFTQAARSGTDVVLIDKVLKRYGEYIAVDLSNIDPISILRGEKWLVWGPNGSGKSTLIKMIIDTIRNGNFLPDEGRIEVGVGVQMSYYTPEVPSDITSGLLIDEVTEKIDNHDQGKAASVLRFFGFPKTAIYKQNVNTLSSGEKKRLALAKIIIKRPNFIILDEPTGDYMPEQIKERLASILEKFDGTLILVSHDLKLINSLKITKDLQMLRGKVVIQE